ncbi:hypothetical protein [Pseudoalteromonas luteoviolacea]|uniref:Uncharacterized protein n=1 Tax=Pseudoalteromonas luteoviolacea NCIMB 1942 TaxID=1365253 RepID=A0A167AYJ3_9GAMM|nr:hypothetical protein [Pseudoalteromonas luteoviolacea]KZN45947.1 hypothetical protein N482_13415 [Pseudoalteromonas luteoviolacea NCIMB 1942]
MFKKHALIGVLTLLLVACQTTQKASRPANASDYENDLTAPKLAGELLLVDRKVFDQPEYGMSLKYVDESFPEDFVTVYIYPIAKTNWSDTEKVVAEELQYVMDEVEAAKKLGKYQEVQPATMQMVKFESQSKQFLGKQAQFVMQTRDGAEYHSEAYVFIAEDKYIKFRLSFPKHTARENTGIDIVKSILPEIEVPKESEYMYALRESHRKEMIQKLMKLLIDNAKSDQS